MSFRRNGLRKQAIAKKVSLELRRKREILSWETKEGGEVWVSLGAGEE